MYETGCSPGIILGAFSGSVIFVISATEYTLWTKVALFFCSINVGIFSAKCMATVINLGLIAYANLHIPIPEALGAAISAAGAVRFLMYLATLPMQKGELLNKLKRGNKNDIE